ncbi:MAG: autotransporter-associated beta strand repeat-containing protein [Planctomycetota bacterium]|nr:autotransporter-associated beta strand repeat-containing protein [Planctomycetota bacterium]
MFSRNTRSLLGLLVAAMLGLVLVAPVQAATGTWNGPNLTGTWGTTEANWTGLVPGTPWDLTNGPTNTASFNTDNNVANVSGAIYANTVAIGASGNTVNVASGGALGINGGSLNFGVLNNALVVNGTGILTMNAISGRNIGLDSGSGQSITVQGGGTMTFANTATSSGTLYMGSSSALAPNTLTVTGLGSTFTNGDASNRGANIWLSGSNAQIIVSDGGVFTSLSRSIYVAGRWGGNSNNSLSITGAGQLTTNSTISLSPSSDGSATNMTLMISSGGKAYSTSGRIGYWSGNNDCTATITGIGSLWNLGSGTLYLGNNAGASGNTLNVANGGSLNNVGSVLMNGTNNRFNLGSGGAELLSTATLNTVTLGSIGALLNIDNGRLIARTTGSLVSGGGGGGRVVLNGLAYIYTDFASTIDTLIEGTVLGTLFKQGGGTLTLSQANTYLGDTQVDAGTLSISNAYLADASAVKIASLAIMDLNFTGIDTVGAVWLGGSNMGGGTFNAATQPAYFTGGGSLYVVPEPATMAFVVLGGVGLLARRRSRKA